MIKDDISRIVSEAVRRAQSEGALPAVALPEVAIERPQRPEHGDYATSLALRLARAMRSQPVDIAGAIANHIELTDAISSAEVAPPGFINFRLSQDWLTRQVETVLAEGETFSDLNLGVGQKAQLEYVSANPVGPLHVGNGRWGAIGSTLANVLKAVGYGVEQEYYVNDMGTQIDTFATTLYARYQQLFGRDIAIPEEGYPGAYMIDVAEAIRSEHGDAFLRPPGELAPREMRDIGVEKMLTSIAADLASMGVVYDRWFRESSLHVASSAYQVVLQKLRADGFVTEKEGAVWFTSTALGEDKDNVLIRSNGSPTYFASDIAYHYNKLVERGFQRVIDIWGADHQGHVPRMRAAIAALGVERERFDVLIGQLVTLKRGGEVVRISKRSGDIITLREVVEEVGTDACRFFFLTSSPNATMDFDLELAKKQSAENPVYYVQYGHARIASILTLAQERGIDWADGDPSLLVHEAEQALIRKMLELPEILETIARSLEPHHLPHYAIALATTFHDFYEKCRVISSEPGDLPITKARLKLVAAAKIALARTLGLMGMAAPERM